MLDLGPPRRVPSATTRPHRTESLESLMRHPTHLQAKSKQGNWLSGYQVVTAQVLRTFGDAKLTGKLPMAGAARAFAHGGPSA